MGKQPPNQIQTHHPHQRQERPAGENQKKYREIILGRTFIQIELGMDPIVGKSGCGFWVAVQIRANHLFIVCMGDRVGIRGTQHLVHRLPPVHMAIQAIGNPFTQKKCRLPVKGFAVRVSCPGGQSVTVHDFGIVVATGAHLGHVARVADLMQSGSDMVVESINEIVLFVAYPAASGSGLGDAGTHGLKKGKRSVQGIIMAV